MNAHEYYLEILRINSRYKNLLSVRKRLDSEKEDIRQSAEKDKKKLLGLDAERKLVSNKIDPTLLEKYLILKERYQGGLVIVPVQDAICRGCNVNLPPQLYNELHRCDTLRFCPNCHRIIYWRKQQ